MCLLWAGGVGMWMREEGGEVENRRRILLKKLLQAIPGTLIKHLSLGTSTCASAPSSSSGRVRVCVRIRVCVCVCLCVHGAGRRRGIPGDVL
jgi:hypothetical protein